MEPRRVEEIAASVLWLCSPGASFIVGVALPSTADTRRDEPPSPSNLRAASARNPLPLYITGAAAPGSVITNVLPTPGWLSTHSRAVSLDDALGGCRAS